MIASLAMYDWPQMASSIDWFWTEIRDNLRAGGLDAPDQLERKTPFFETWNSPDLLFSQTCGRPYRLQLHEKVTLVGTPDYGQTDCPPGYYRSPFLVRARDPRVDLADFRTARFAYNEKLSQSGWAAPQVHVAGLGYQFDNTLETGGHVHSARAVAEGAADIAALDGLTWELVKRYEDFSLELRVLEWTRPTPGLPYICGLNQPREAIARAVSTAITALDLADRRTLRLKGLVQIPAKAYLAVPNP
jgi:ABC-type phosphate/phosphonate transport system substrate-binding protein